MDLLDSVIEYLYELTEDRIFPSEISKEEKNLLPLFITQKFTVERAKILGKEYVLLLHEEGEIPTPAQAQNYLTLVENKFEGEVAFVFPRLDSFIRNRLISKRVPFIVPNQHLYLPKGLADIREQSSKIDIGVENKISISDPAQVILLYFLIYRDGIDDWELKDWAERLNYSQMSISRAWKELATINLCEGRKKGRRIILQFTDSSRTLWERALPYLHTPIRHRKIAIIQDKNRMKLMMAGITALANKTQISKGPRAEYATKLTDWNAAIKDELAYEVSAAHEKGITVETWRYNPQVLAPHSEFVDDLSLYLSLRDSADERIQGALKDLVERFSW